MEGRTTPGARTPYRSPLLERRVAGGLVDLAIIGLITAAVAVVTSTRVPAIRQADGSVSFTASDRALIDAMTGPLSRGHLLGDTLWAFSTSAVVVVLGSAVFGGAIVGVLVPRLLGGRSPGKFLFRMRVETVDGLPPGVIRHLIRTLVSPADLMPVVVPGLTGYAFAASNPRYQRIGDRLAGTVVVNQDWSGEMIVIASAIGSGVDAGDSGRMRPVPAISSATLLHTHPTARTETSLNRRRESPDLLVDEAASPSRAGETVDMNENDSAIEHSGPSSPASGPVPVEERSNNPYPKPVRRRRKAEQGPTLPDFDSLTLPESSLSDMPLTNTALLEALGLTNPDSTAAAEADAPADSGAAEVPRADRPIADGVADSEPAGQPTKLAVRQASRPSPNRRAPIWSEDWDAWIYWDTTLEHWFRHDMASDNWVPMDEE